MKSMDRPRAADDFEVIRAQESHLRSSPQTLMGQRTDPLIVPIR
jgi:hypothetical protein